MEPGRGAEAGPEPGVWLQVEEQVEDIRAVDEPTHSRSQLAFLRHSLPPGVGLQPKAALEEDPDRFKPPVVGTVHLLLCRSADLQLEPKGTETPLKVVETQTFLTVTVVPLGTARKTYTCCCCLSQNSFLQSMVKTAHSPKNIYLKMSLMSIKQ